MVLIGMVHISPFRQMHSTQQLLLTVNKDIFSSLDFLFLWNESVSIWKEQLPFLTVHKAISH